MNWWIGIPFIVGVFVAVVVLFSAGDFFGSGWTSDGPPAPRRKPR